MDGQDLLENIKARRVSRSMKDQPVERIKLEKILEAARWAPAAGNQRMLRFVAIQEPETLRLLRMVSPGMLQRPTAAVVICRDLDKLPPCRLPSDDPAAYIDIGAAMQNMMLAAHVLGLGSGPVTSFSKEAVRVLLNLPVNLVPELILCVGYPSAGDQLPMRPKQKVTWQSLTDWERY